MNVLTGIKNIDDIDESLTLGDVAVSEVNIEEVRAVIKDTYKIDYTSDRLRTTPISRYRINDFLKLMITKPELRS